MDARALTKLLIKIAGLFTLFLAVIQVPSYLGNIPTMWSQSAPWWTYLLGVAIPVTFYLGVAAAMLLLPGTIANFVVHPSGDTERTNKTDIARIEEAAIALLAVYLFFRGISDAAYWIAKTKLVFLIMESQSFPARTTFSPEELGGMFSTAAELILATCLFLGARGIVRLKNKVRGGDEE